MNRVMNCVCIYKAFTIITVTDLIFHRTPIRFLSFYLFDLVLGSVFPFLLIPFSTSGQTCPPTALSVPCTLIQSPLAFRTQTLCLRPCYLLSVVTQTTDSTLVSVPSCSSLSTYSPWGLPLVAVLHTEWPSSVQSLLTESLVSPKTHFGDPLPKSLFSVTPPDTPNSTTDLGTWT